VAWLVLGAIGGPTVGRLSEVQVVIPSADKKALLLTVQLNGDRADEVVKNGETVLFAVADQMRNEIK
jgi:RND superfamily putative drug exporter